MPRADLITILPPAIWFDQTVLLTVTVSSLHVLMQIPPERIFRENRADSRDEHVWDRSTPESPVLLTAPAWHTGTEAQLCVIIKQN